MKPEKCFSHRLWLSFLTTVFSPIIFYRSKNQPNALAYARHLTASQRSLRESNSHLVLRSKALGIFLWDYLCFILSLKIPDLRAFLALVGTSLSAFILSLKAPVSGINVSILYINFTSMDFYFVRGVNSLLFRKHSSAGLYKYWGGGQIGTYLFITSIGNCSFILSTTQSCK